MIQAGIYGYGNLGRGVELALQAAPDFVPAAVFTRRPGQVHPLTPGLPVLHENALGKAAPHLDVVILCGSSADDLPVQTPACAALTSFVDSFDDHHRIPAHYKRVDRAACLAGTVGIICAGWDPGLFSTARCIAGAVFPTGHTATFWGPGLSQGHSAAIRRLPGVLDARQYTVPLPGALDQARGEAAALPDTQRHRRICYVALQPVADPAAIEAAIRQMPGYFAGYETEIHFISSAQLAEEHAGLSHAGRIVSTGRTGQAGEHRHQAECSLQLDSNPEFTGSVLVAYARAAVRLYRRGQRGCRTPLDIPPALLHPDDGAQLRADLL